MFFLVVTSLTTEVATVSTSLSLGSVLKVTWRGLKGCPLIPWKHHAILHRDPRHLWVWHPRRPWNETSGGRCASPAPLKPCLPNVLMAIDTRRLSFPSVGETHHAKDITETPSDSLLIEVKFKATPGCSFCFALLLWNDFGGGGVCTRN